MKRQWLVDARNSQHKTQQEVADAAGTSQSSYANIESGVRIPSVPVAKRIAAVLGFDWTLFFGEAETAEEVSPQK